jgi:hypothetical protein
MKVCNLALKTVCRTPYIDRPFPERIGSCTVVKLQRILANRRFSQHAKLNMAGFVLYLLGSFALRCRMVSVCPKIKSVLPQRTQRPRSSVIALKPTPIWDGLGCSGIPREGGGVPQRTRLSPETNPKTHRQECRCHTDHRVIAVIAGNGKAKPTESLPLINTDNTDLQRSGHLVIW